MHFVILPSKLPIRPCNCCDFTYYNENCGLEPPQNDVLAGGGLLMSVLSELHVCYWMSYSVCMVKNPILLHCWLSGSCATSSWCSRTKQLVAFCFSVWWLPLGQRAFACQEVSDRFSGRSKENPSGDPFPTNNMGCRARFSQPCPQSDPLVAGTIGFEFPHATSLHMKLDLSWKWWKRSGCFKLSPSSIHSPFSISCFTGDVTRYQ